MKKQVLKTRIVFVYFMLLAATIMAVFYFSRARKLQREFAAAQVLIKEESASNKLLTRFLAVDSLIQHEKYEEAREVCGMLMSENPANLQLQQAARARINTTRRLEELDTTYLSSENRELARELGKVNEQLTSLETDLALAREIKADQLDSLNFALDKARLRANSLENKLNNKSGTDYLEFTGKNDVTIFYVGEVRNDKATGEGVALYSTGSRYEGKWKNNLRHGEGVFHWPDGEYYEGQFKQDKRHGYGKYFWPNGEKFAGQWQNGKRNGEGKFFNEKGKIIASGTWQNDELVEMSNR